MWGGGDTRCYELGPLMGGSTLPILICSLMVPPLCLCSEDDRCTPSGFTSPCRPDLREWCDPFFLARFPSELECEELECAELGCAEPECAELRCADCGVGCAA